MTRPLVLTDRDDVAVVFELRDRSTVALRPAEVRELAAAADAIRAVFGRGECRVVRSRALGGGCG